MHFKENIWIKIVLGFLKYRIKKEIVLKKSSAIIVELAIIEKINLTYIGGLLWDTYYKITLQNFPNREHRDH